LRETAGSGEAAVLQRLLANANDTQRAELLRTDFGNGWTALYIAAAKGHDAVVKALLSEPVTRDQITDQLNAKNKDGWTALHIAAEYGRIAVVKALLSSLGNEKRRQAQLETKDRYGRIALHLAAQNGHIAVVEALLKPERVVLQEGSAVSQLKAQDEDGWTPLHYLFACEAKDETARRTRVGTACTLLNAYKENGIDIATTLQNNALKKCGNIWKEIVSTILSNEAFMEIAGKVLDFSGWLNGLKDFIRNTDLETWGGIVQKSENDCRDLFTVLAFLKDEHSINVEALAAGLLRDYGFEPENFLELLGGRGVPIESSCPFEHLLVFLKEYSQTPDQHLADFLRIRNVDVERLFLGILRQGGINIGIFLNFLKERDIDMKYLFDLVRGCGIDTDGLRPLLQDYGVDVGALLAESANKGATGK
jgi:ankyrin repeat protein